MKSVIEMSYVKATNILPVKLLEMIQEYVDGTYLYIPQKCGNRKKWGESKDSKTWYKNRNHQIYLYYKKGVSVKEISEQFFLSEKSVYRIILQEKRQF